MLKHPPRNKVDKNTFNYAEFNMRLQVTYSTFINDQTLLHFSDFD